LSVVYSEDNKTFDKAVRYIEKALSLDGGNAVFHFTYGQLLTLKGKFDDAKKSFQRAAQLNSDMKNEVNEELKKLKKLEES
ncbi:tetratricopeptide repeat protein, partial [bacterium]|nr:tetratricopeptide repeat protein [bacterium]